MVTHQLIVNSFNKILPRLKANAVKSANLIASKFVLYLLSTSCVLTLAFSTFFSSCHFWGYSTSAQFLPTRGSSPRATRSMRTSKRSSPSRRPCGAQLPRGFIMFYAFAYSVPDFCHYCNK